MIYKLMINLCKSTDSNAKNLLDQIRSLIMCGVPSLGLEVDVSDSLVQMTGCSSKRAARAINTNWF
jgi:hypothetical protein